METERRFVDTKREIEHRIIRESEELSQDMLSEVLDFILFLKFIFRTSEKSFESTDQ